MQNAVSEKLLTFCGRHKEASVTPLASRLIRYRARRESRVASLSKKALRNFQITAKSARHRGLPQICSARKLIDFQAARKAFACGKRPGRQWQWQRRRGRRGRRGSQVTMRRRSCRWQNSCGSVASVAAGCRSYALCIRGATVGCSGSYTL